MSALMKAMQVYFCKSLHAVLYSFLEEALLLTL